MKKKYQTAFFLFGVIVLAIMVSQLDFREAWEGITHAGYWFAAVVGIWVFLYLFNTTSWMLIIRSLCGKRPDVSFSFLYRLTVTGFSLNYATPGGLMGGEPYRVMSLAPKIGTEKATSSVILFTMTHIFSHFWFWLLSVVAFLLTQHLTPLLVAVMTGIFVFALTGIVVFQFCYRYGVAMFLLRVLKKFPGLRSRIQGFLDKHEAQVREIDVQISTLQRQNVRILVAAVLLELVCRILGGLEVYFVLRVLTDDVSFLQCVLIMAFTSLFANLLFFIPLQLGGREGGFLMSTSAMLMPASHGIFIGLLIRLRELIWVAIGLLFIFLTEKKKGKIIDS